MIKLKNIIQKIAVKLTLNKMNKKIINKKEIRLICRTRSRIRQALRGKTKSSSTINLLGMDIETYKKWIQWQFTPEMNWSKTELDHVKPFCMFDLSKDEELREAFSWKNTQPLLKQDHLHKGTKFSFLDYQL